MLYHFTSSCVWFLVRSFFLSYHLIVAVAITVVITIRRTSISWWSNFFTTCFHHYCHHLWLSIGFFFFFGYPIRCGSYICSMMSGCAVVCQSMNFLYICSMFISNISLPFAFPLLSHIFFRLRWAQTLVYTISYIFRWLQKYISHGIKPDQIETGLSQICSCCWLKCIQMWCYVKVNKKKITEFQATNKVAKRYTSPFNVPHMDLYFEMRRKIVTIVVHFQSCFHLLVLCVNHLIFHHWKNGIHCIHICFSEDANRTYKHHKLHLSSLL